MTSLYQDPRLDLEEGWAKYQRDDYRGALELLSKSVTMLPKDPLAHYRLGFCLRSLQEHAAALDSFRAAAVLQPEDPWNHFQVGRELAFLGRRREALTLYSQAIERNPQFTEAYNDLGAILGILGFYELSAAAYAAFSVLADITIEATGSAPIHIGIFETSTNTLKRALGPSRYSQIQESILAELGNPQAGEIDPEGFSQIAHQIVAAIRRIKEGGIADEGWSLRDEFPQESSWLPFSGKAHEKSGKIILIGNFLNGAILAKPEDVRQRGAKVEVFRQARVVIVDAPLESRNEVSGRNDLTCCIGEIEVLCSTGEIVGPCTGVWGCCDRHREGLAGMP